MRNNLELRFQWRKRNNDRVELFKRLEISNHALWTMIDLKQEVWFRNYEILKRLRSFYEKFAPFLPSWATLTSNNVFSPTHTNFLKNEPDRPSPQLHSELADDIADRCARILWRNYEKNKRKSTISDHKLGFLIIFKIVSRPPKQALQPPIKSFGPQDLFVKTLVSASLG